MPQGQRTHKMPAPRRRPLRTLLRIVAWVIGVPVLALLVWLIYNCIDEAPSADALRWSQSPVRDVADADNAWLYLYGIGAAEDEDPVSLGRRRVDLYEARLRGDPRAPADAAESTASDPLPQVRIDAQRDGIAEHCPFRDGDCIAWAAQNRAALLRLAEANRVRLQRFETLLQLPQWHEAATVSLDMPIPPTDIAVLRLDLLALAASDAARSAEVAAAIATQVAFWRRASEQGNWLVSKILGFVFVERCQRLLVNLYERSAPAQRASIEAALAATLAPPSAAASRLDILAQEHFQSTSRGLRDSVPGLWQSLRNCVRGAPVNGSCASDLMLSTTFLPQATANVVARLDTAMADYQAATPEQENDAAQRYAELVERENPLADGNAALRLFGYNASGKVLAFVAIPKANYRQRLNDYEALRRILVVKVAALQRGLRAPDMPEFLATQPPALRNPYTHRAFDWDAANNTILYTAATADSFKRAQIAIGYAPVPVVPAAASTRRPR